MVATSKGRFYCCFGVVVADVIRSIGRRKGSPWKIVGRLLSALLRLMGSVVAGLLWDADCFLSLSLNICGPLESKLWQHLSPTR